MPQTEGKVVFVNGKPMPTTLAFAIAAVFSSAPKVDGHREVCEALAKRLPKEWPDAYPVKIAWGKYTQTSTLGGLRQGVAFGLSIVTVKAGAVSASTDEAIASEIASLKM